MSVMITQEVEDDYNFLCRVLSDCDGLKQNTWIVHNILFEILKSHHKSNFFINSKIYSFSEKIFEKILPN